MPGLRRVRQPQYFDSFRCIGADCEDTCCEGWGIIVDRVTFEKYQDPLVYRVAGEALSDLVEINPAGTSSSDYARFRLSGTRCPALQGGLCSIQQALGESNIADLCSSYPRVLNVTSGAVERSLHLSLSGGGAADSQGSGGDGFQRARGRRTSASAWFAGGDWRCAGEDHLNEIRSLAIDVIKERSRPLWQRIASFGFVTDKHLKDHLNRFRSGLFDEVLNRQQVAPAVHLEMVLELIVARIGSDYTSARFLDCYRDFMRGLNWTAESSMEELASRYQSAFQNDFLPFIEKHEHLFENYLVNYIFRTFFPYRCKKPLQSPAIDSSLEAMRDALLLLAVHYAIVRTVMIGMAALHKDKLSMDHAIKLVQSYSKAFMHSSSFEASALESLSKIAEDPARKVAILVMD